MSEFVGHDADRRTVYTSRPTINGALDRADLYALWSLAAVPTHSYSCGGPVVTLNDFSADANSEGSAGSVI